jgi:autotransporter-associated beta strand protein
VVINANSAGATAGLDLNGNSATIGTLTFGGTGGTPTATNYLSVGGGTLTLGGGSLAYDATGNPLGAALSGQMTFAVPTTVAVGDSTSATIDLALSAIIAGLQGATFTKTGLGTLDLSGANTYQGRTSLGGGTVRINSIANIGGGASALGAPGTIADGTIDIGSGATSATLQYVGPAATTDRVLNLAGTTGGAVIDSSGSGALTFTSALGVSGAGSKSLTFAGRRTVFRAARPSMPGRSRSRRITRWAPVVSAYRVARCPFPAALAWQAR